MMAGDLRCPKCGAKPVDVDPSYGEFPPNFAVKWKCLNGHQHISGTTRLGHKGEFTHMEIKP